MKLFFESQFFSSIIGVIIGGFLGFGSSYYINRSQNKTEIKNIIKGFYIEICSLEDEIMGYVNIIKNNPNKIFRFENGTGNFADGRFG